MLELLINQQDKLKTIILLEDGNIIEKHEEYDKQKRIEGNIYSGVVQSVLQGMQAAFIDIGQERNTFIRLKDLLPKKDEKDEEENKSIDVNIKEIIKPQDKILVQIKRDGSFKKGARGSTHVNLPRQVCCAIA